MKVENKIRCPFRKKLSGWCLLVNDWCKIYGLVEGSEALSCKAEKVLDEKKQGSLF